jgi:hypothetical protein
MGLVMSADRQTGQQPGRTRALLFGLAGFGVCAALVATIWRFAPSIEEARARTSPDARAIRSAEGFRARAPARERELGELRRRVSELESAALAEKEAPRASETSESRDERLSVPHETESPEKMQPRVLQTMAEMDERFAGQGARSDWSAEKEQSLRAGMSALGEEQRGHVRSLDCREAMCRMEVEYESGRQAAAFLDEIGSRGGFGNARSTRLRPKLGEERYVFYVEPRTSRMTSTQ